MKIRLELKPILAAWLLSACGLQPSTAQAQGTAFTYQGRLSVAGVPANGSYDVLFRVYDAPTGGSPLTVFPFIRPVEVNNGLFSLPIDFGAAPFTGNPVYLEIQVRTNGAANYTTVLPRQPITPAPYAIFASNVPNGSVDTPQLASGAVTGGKIANGAVDTSQLAGSAVTSAKVADGTLQPADLNLGNFDRTFWKVGGNTGTSSDFIGTTDDQPFDVRVNSVRVMRYRLNTDPDRFYTNAPNVIGGSSINGTVTTDVVGATIAGGGGSFTNVLGGGFIADPNRVTGSFGTVGGGKGNNAGTFATVPGGNENTATGLGSFAAGEIANADQNSSFVWGDGTVVTSSASANSVTMRASGGFRFFTGNSAVGAKLASGDTSWSSICDRNEKKNFQPVDAEAVLAKLAATPVQSWNYKWEADTNPPHLGPMAQDFKTAFYPGRDDKSISTLEFDGVELAAIQGLNRKLEQEVKEKNAKIGELESRLSKLEALISSPVVKTETLTK